MIDKQPVWRMEMVCEMCRRKVRLNVDFLCYQISGCKTMLFMQRKYRENTEMVMFFLFPLMCTKPWPITAIQTEPWACWMVAPLHCTIITVHHAADMWLLCNVTSKYRQALDSDNWNTVCTLMILTFCMQNLLWINECIFGLLNFWFIDNWLQPMHVCIGHLLVRSLITTLKN